MLALFVIVTMFLSLSLFFSSSSFSSDHHPKPPRHQILLIIQKMIQTQKYKQIQIQKNFIIHSKCMKCNLAFWVNRIPHKNTKRTIRQLGRSRSTRNLDVRDFPASYYVLEHRISEPVSPTSKDAKLRSRGTTNTHQLHGYVDTQCRACNSLIPESLHSLPCTRHKRPYCHKINVSGHQRLVWRPRPTLDCSIMLDQQTGRWPEVQPLFVLCGAAKVWCPDMVKGRFLGVFVIE